MLCLVAIWLLRGNQSSCSIMGPWLQTAVSWLPLYIKLCANANFRLGSEKNKFPQHSMLDGLWVSELEAEFGEMINCLSLFPSSSPSLSVIHVKVISIKIAFSGLIIVAFENVRFLISCIGVDAAENSDSSVHSRVTPYVQIDILLELTCLN